VWLLRRQEGLDAARGLSPRPLARVERVRDNGSGFFAVWIRDRRRRRRYTSVRHALVLR
jgi:hypothetical protein